jgi:putative Holliday junction resolvase
VRVVGLDLGERRIGVAVSDSDGVVASPYTTIHRGADADAARAAVVSVVEELGAGLVVVGLPLSLHGQRGPAARAAEAEAQSLGRLLAEHAVAVETFDERFTTVTAERSLVDAGRRGRSRRRVVDQAAAAVMLQAYLDARRGRPGAEP